MMFHDIQDVSPLHLGNFPGGVPMFWALLAAHTRRHRTHEFTHSPPDAKLPSFGLGVLMPNHQGTCEPEVAEASWTPPWTLGDGSVETAWKELCRLNRTKLCGLGIKKIGEANGILEGGKSSQVQRSKLRLYA